jgi:ArsR family transcriptional regulator
MELSIIFKTLGDDIRIRILGLLLERELCVCDIESILKISQANVSRHLTKMKIAGILSSRKNAQWVYYSISKKFIELHPEIITALEAEVKKLKNYKSDIKAMAALNKKKIGDGC